MREISNGRLMARQRALKDTPAFPHTPDIPVKRAAADRATDYWEPLFVQAVQVIDELMHQYNRATKGGELDEELLLTVESLHLPLGEAP